MALGIPGSGGAGLITSISCFTDKVVTLWKANGPIFFVLCMLQDATGGTYFVGFLILCVAVGFCVSALADFFMLTKVFRWNPLKTCQL